MSGNSIADSSAVSFPNRILIQHHTAITLLANALAARPPGDALEWLDLGCGRGQIIAHLDDTLPDSDMRSRIHYSGYDVDNAYTREAEKKAASLNLGMANVIVGQLDHFAQLMAVERQFSFVTFTNVIHELPPVLAGSLMLELLARLKSDGKLYIYDMETLPEPELGAVPWDANDVRRLWSFIYKELGATASPPMVPRWPHSSCFGWSVDFDRAKLDVDGEKFAGLLPELKTKTSSFIVSLFKEKLDRTIGELEAITKYGDQTGAEQKRKMNLLFDYWSLSRLY